MKKLMSIGIAVVLAVNTGLSFTPINSDPDGVVKRLWESVKRGEMTERELLLEVEALARKYRALVDASLGFDDNPLTQSPEYDRCRGALMVLKEIGDRHSLPLFEEMTTSKHLDIRTRGFDGYAQVAGAVDYLQLIERLPDKPMEKTKYFSRPDFSTAYLVLGWEIERKPPSPKEMEKICTFLLEKVQTEEGGIIQKDTLLCTHLLGYKTSVQRMAMVERFTNSNSEYQKTLWNAAKEEIEKVPVNQRKDFRAKGELLDPEKKGD